jgi:16S rRNA (cytidine1402-2'-O)-methyltransferase
LQELSVLPGTLVLYESPFRIVRLVAELTACMPGREVVLARELTKKFEEWLRGRPAELAQQLEERPRKGEFVVMIGPAEERRGNLEEPDARDPEETSAR